jgi:hypothetical protein
MWYTLKDFHPRTKTKDANSQTLNLKKEVWLWNIQNQINMDFND